MLLLVTIASWTLVGFVAAVFFAVRLFASRHGHRPGWSPGSYDRERQHLRFLANGDDRSLARTARLLLKMDAVAWVLVLPGAALLLTCIALR
jgi:hypothetical protein